MSAGIDGSMKEIPSPKASGRVQGRRGRLITASVIAVALVATAGPALASTRSAAQRGFHTSNGSSGEVSVNTCSYAVSVAVAHCNARVRTDATARSERPSKKITATPSLVGNGGAYDPAFLQSAYNIASLSAAKSGGVGQIVAIVDAYDDPNLVSDLAFYRSNFGLSSCPTGVVSPTATGCVLQVVNQNGASSPLPIGDTGWATETSLDVDMVSAICPACQILVVEGNSAQLTDLGTAVNTAVAMGANVVSNSYGASEFSTEDNYSNAYYNHPGVPIVVSSGDSGYGVEFPAASPLVTAVGGTSLTQTSNTGTRNGTETVWSGAGAGCSAFEAKPAWQHDSGCAKRTVADVSAVANPSTGVWVYDTYGYAGFAIYGGTSVAAPIISAIYALAANPLGTSNVPASYLYNSPGSLFAVTSGSDGTCGSYLCDAALSIGGYNGPAGLGTPGGTPNSLAAFLANPGPATAPSAPSLTGATPGNGSVALTWSPPVSNGGSVITGYNVFAGTSPGGESLTPVNASLISGTTYSVTGLTNGTTYYFTVVAVNAVGPSVSSNERSATPVAVATTPGAPTLVSAAPANGSVTLSWTAPTNTGGGITGYNVYRGTSSGKESSTPVNASLVTSTTFTSTGLVNGTTYYFYVKAVNSAGTSAASNQLSAKPATTPSTPNSLVAATARRTGVQLSWNAPSNGGSSITSYTLYRSNSSGTEVAYLTVACTSSSCSYNDTTTTKSAVYYYQVAAINSIGIGPRSLEAHATAR